MHRGNTMTWQKAESAVIDKNAMYLIRTDGRKFGDGDLYMRPGFSIPSMLTPNVVRGRALFVALITEPEDL